MKILPISAFIQNKPQRIFKKKLHGFSGTSIQNRAVSRSEIVHLLLWTISFQGIIAINRFIQHTLTILKKQW